MILRHSFLIVMMILPSLCRASNVWSIPAARGIWWYSTTQHKMKKMPQTIQKPRTKTMTQAKKINCNDPAQWQLGCGFVDPTHSRLAPQKAFQFEQQEYHQLIRQFSLYPNNIEAVLQFQKFNHWAVGQAMTASYTWQYNSVQHPELGATSYDPISEFGQHIVDHIEATHEKDFFKLLSKTSLIVFFSRSDCEYCHQQAPLVLQLAKVTGIPTWNASLDDKPLPGFKHSLTANQSIIPARLLKVATVPTLFLYLGPNSQGEGDKWIRLATGLTDEETIKNRLIDFSEAYRHAILVGSSQGKKHLAPNFKQLHNNPLIGRQR